MYMAVSITFVSIVCLVSPEVEVTTTRPRVNLDGSTTLFCNVTRTNPAITGTYQWVRVGTSEMLLENSDTLVLNITSEMDFGNYSCTVMNTAGVSGSGIIAIERGCKCEWKILLTCL